MLLISLKSLFVYFLTPLDLILKNHDSSERLVEWRLDSRKLDYISAKCQLLTDFLTATYCGPTSAVAPTWLTRLQPEHVIGC